MAIAKSPGKLASQRDEGRRVEGGDADGAPECREISAPNIGKFPKDRRTLIHIPVLHTEADMGSLSPAIKERKIHHSNTKNWEHSVDCIDATWTHIEEAIAGWSLPYEKVRIYQDGLPVCGHELEIVKDLAAAGSRNHQLLLRLKTKGATIMGTESAELLVREYRLIKATLLAKSTEAPPPESGPLALGRDLLRQRDQAIAARINDTLRQGEIGLLFLGMLHALDQLLPTDMNVIRFVYPEFVQ
jgi:hypothetical protein